MISEIRLYDIDIANTVGCEFGFDYVRISNKTNYSIFRIATKMSQPLILYEK